MRRHPVLPLLAVLSLFLAGLLSSAVSLADAPTGVIAGVVKDKRGRPVPNVWVRVLAGPLLADARTDGDGKYGLEDLPAGQYELNAQKPGYATVRKARVEVAAKGTTAVNFTLEWADPTAGAVEVLIQDPAGNPLPQATVDLLAGSSLVNRLSTDAAGSAVFPGLAPNFFNVAGRRPGFFEAFSRSFQVRAGGITAVVLQLRPDPSQTGKLAGIVRSLNGGPFANATVRIIAGTSGGQATTSPAGDYRFDALVPGEGYAIQVSAAGFATQILGNITVLLGQTTVVDAVLIPNLPGRGSLAGRVKDAFDRPIPFATVSITAGPGLGQQVLSGEDGRYAFTDLEPAPNYAVVAEQVGYAPAGLSGIVVAAGKTTLADLSLRNQTNPLGSFGGTVREAGNGKLLAGVLVEIIQGSSAGLAVTTDTAGFYEIEGVQAGANYTLRFTKEGYQPRTAPLLTVRVGVRTAVDAALTPSGGGTGTLRGTVRRAGSRPVAGARVVLFAGPAGPLETTTDRNGAYSFANLPAGGGYGVRAEKRAFAPAERTGLQVRSGETLTVDFELQAAASLGSIAGDVRDLLNHPLEDASVRVIQGPARPAPARTGADGTFLLEALPRGIYTLEVTASGFRTEQRTGISVTPANTTRLVFQLLQ
jgi:carboxypeptidase family protein